MKRLILRFKGTRYQETAKIWNAVAVIAALALVWTVYFTFLKTTILQ